MLEKKAKATADCLAVIEGVKKYYPVKGKAFLRERAFLKAVNGVDLEIRRGEILGLVGESGCGKSTLGRLLLRLEEVTEGRILFEGNDISRCDEKTLRQIRASMQMIFQDPYDSLNPRMRVGKIIEEPLIIHGKGDRKWREREVKRLMTEVGLIPDQASLYPHEFSGGQRQRIGIARALALQPKLIVADEPISALDVSIQAQIVNLLVDLQAAFQLTYLFIAHDLRLIRHISDRIVVMYMGKIMEVVDKQGFSTPPNHPYTEALLAAAPVLGAPKLQKRNVIKGEVPSAIRPPTGCVFRTRCPYVETICSQESPLLRELEPNHKIACHFAG